MKVNVVLYTSS